MSKYNSPFSKAYRKPIVMAIDDIRNKNFGIHKNRVGSDIIVNDILNAPKTINLPDSSAKVVVAAYGASMSTSSDGYVWNSDPIYQTTIPNQPEYANWTGVAYGNGYFVAVSSEGKVSRSRDGRYWSYIIHGSSYHWNSISFGNGVFVALPIYGQYCGVSSDNGSTWNIVDLSALNASPYSVTFGSGKFIVSAAYGKILSSTDGQNWSQVSGDIGSDPYKQYSGIASFTNNKFFIVGFTCGIRVSSDGQNWSSYNFPTSSGTYSPVAYGNGVYVISVYGTNKVYTSTNGTTWVSTVSSSLPSTSWGRICFTNNHFVMLSGVDSDSPAGIHFATSPDGYIWTWNSRISGTFGTNTSQILAIG